MRKDFRCEFRSTVLEIRSDEPVRRGAKQMRGQVGDWTQSGRFSGECVSSLVGLVAWEMALGDRFQF
jgi:hypothetical protein